MGAPLVAKDLVVCAHCEEQVNAHAARCPYCQYDLSAPFATKSAAKDPLQILSLNPKICHLDTGVSKVEEPQEASEEVSTEEPSSFVKILVPLFSLLCGSFFLFFSFLLKFFAKNGKLTLEWSSAAWPSYFFPALLFVVIGLFSLSLAGDD